MILTLNNASIRQGGGGGGWSKNQEETISKACFLFLYSAPYGKPVDIWAIGCILGELSDGQVG